MRLPLGEEKRMNERLTRLLAVADRQYGVFSGDQAVAAGIPRRTVQRRAANGEWERIIGDTYRMPGGALTWQQSIMAALLSCGQPCAAARLSAAAVWEIGEPAPVPQLVVPRGRRPRRDGIDVAVTARWGRLDVVRRGPLLVTTMARTLVDLAPVLPELELEMMMDRAHRRGLRFRPFLSYLRHPANRQRPGVGRLLDLASDRDPDRPVESELETRLFAVLRGAGLPLPQRQVWVRTRGGRRRIDLAYTEPKLALEAVGFTWHESGLQSFEDDKARDAEIAEAGYDRRYITKSKLERTPADVVWTVGIALGLQPFRWRRSRAVPSRRSKRSKGG